MKNRWGQTRNISRDSRGGNEIRPRIENGVTKFHRRSRIMWHRYHQLKKKTKNRQKLKPSKFRKPSRNHTPRFVCLKTPAIFVSSKIMATKFKSPSIHRVSKCDQSNTYLTTAQDPTSSEETFRRPMGSSTSQQPARHHYKAINENVIVVETILLHVWMGDAYIWKVIGVVRNLVIRLSLEAFVIDTFVKEIFPPEQMRVLYNAALVPIIATLIKTKDNNNQE